MPRSNEAPRQFGTPWVTKRHAVVSKMFGPIRLPYFHTRTVFLRFCAGRRPVDRLVEWGGGGALAPTCQIAHKKDITRRWPHD